MNNVQRVRVTTKGTIGPDSSFRLADTGESIPWWLFSTGAEVEISFEADYVERPQAVDILASLLGYIPADPVLRSNATIITPLSDEEKK